MLRDKVTMNELVSAIITSYKREISVIEKAIVSVLNQSYKPIEIIVVDDNENDSSYSKKLKKFLSDNYPNVIYVKQEGNKGASAARNLGLEYSRGEFIGYLDDDDEWMPNKIQLQMDAFYKGPNDLALVYGEGEVIDYNTNPPTKELYFNANTVEKNLNFEDLLCHDRIGSTSIPLIRREAIVDVGGFCNFLPARQDYELWLRIVQKYKITGIHNILFVYNLYKGEHISSSPQKAYLGYKYIYEEFKREYDNNINLTVSIYSRMYHAAKKAKSKDTISLFIKYGFIKILYGFNNLKS